MTDLINTTFINNKKTTFLNYVNPVVQGEPVTRTTGTLSNFLTAQFGVNTSIWSNDGLQRYPIKFPVPWETIGSGSVGTILGGGIYYPNANTRCVIDTNSSTQRANSSNTNTRVDVAMVGAGTLRSAYGFAVVNDYSLAYVFWDSISRTLPYFVYIGWLKGTGSGGNYNGSQYPRNFVYICNTVTVAMRINIENATTSQSFTVGNPSLSCLISTPGADATDIILRDSISPNNYIGKPWNLIRLPSTAVIGKIYKNTGIDPDTGQVETDQKAFWMCVGTWGTDKIGMRVWTENIT
jgi:hypothetical protein